MNNQSDTQPQPPDQKCQILVNTSKMHFTKRGMKQDNLLQLNNSSYQMITHHEKSTSRQPSGVSYSSGGSSPTDLPSKHANVSFHEPQLQNGIASKSTSCNEARHQSFLTHRANDGEDHVSQDSQLLAKDPKPWVGLVNAKEDDEMQITGYKRSLLRTTFCWFFICLTGGLLSLIMHWWRHLYLIATHEKCSLDIAEKVLIQEHYHGKHVTYYVKAIQEINATMSMKSLQLQAGFSPSSLAKNGSSGNGNTLTLQRQSEVEIDEKSFHISLHLSSGQFKREWYRRQSSRFN